MEPSPTLPLQTLLPLPARGSNARVRVGSSELVLEHVRGGFSLLWSDGREARRHALGLPGDGELVLQLCLPRLPLCVVTRDVLTIAPRGRLRGYVQVPLVPTLVFRGRSGEAHTLIELPSRELAAEWDEANGHSFRVSSPWHVRFPMRSGEPRVVVPMWLHNVSPGVLSPAFLPLQLRDADLHELRGSIVARPRRLQWTGDRFTAVVRFAAVARAV